MSFKGLPGWTLFAPFAGWALIGLATAGVPGADWATPMTAIATAGLIASVLAAVHHAEVVAHRVGEPFGTLVLALAVTVIEVALIVSLMLAAGPAASALARDTVFAAIMIILNGVVGLCLLAGAARHHEQGYVQMGVSAALAVLCALAVLTLILPNATTSEPGPAYSASQLAFVATVSLILYGTFVLVQTVRHRDYFLPVEAAGNEGHHAPPPDLATTATAAAFLVLALGAVVLLAKTLAPSVEAGVAAIGAPKALVGVLIAALVLLPESLAAVRAARANRLQTSLNLALGSALATIGLTIPAVAVLSISMGWTLSLGLDAKGTTLLWLTLLVSVLSLGTGRTTVLQGAVHLVIFAAFLFTTVVP
ncbi:MAG: calcium:proton antiporter [Hyphomicrobium sp.]